MLDKLGSALEVVLSYLSLAETVLIERVCKSHSQSLKRQQVFLSNFYFAAATYEDFKVLAKKYTQEACLYKGKQIWFFTKNSQLFKLDLETQQVKSFCLKSTLKLSSVGAECLLPDDKLFLAGVSFFGISKSYQLDLRTLEFQELPFPDPPIYGSTAVYYNSSIYFFGGFRIHYRGASKNCCRFDLQTQMWKSFASLPESLNHSSSVVFEGCLFITANNTDKVFKYQVRTDTYTSVLSGLGWGFKLLCRSDEELLLLKDYAFCESKNTQNWEMGFLEFTFSCQVQCAPRKYFSKVYFVTDQLYAFSYVNKEVSLVLNIT